MRFGWVLIVLLGLACEQMRVAPPRGGGGGGGSEDAASADVAIAPDAAGDVGLADLGAATDVGLADLGPRADAGLADLGARVDAGAPDLGTRADAGGVATDAGATGASLAGSVTRTTEPRAGGVGGLYIAVFDRNPVTDRANARLVGMALVPNVDMRNMATSIPYRIDGIALRAEPYVVIAFLDDNGTASMGMPGPDRGDLVSLPNFQPIRITLDMAREYPLDIVLNAALPF